MVFRNNLLSMNHILLLMVLFFNGCPEKDPITDPIDTISGIQFTFHQDVNKLYFAASVESSYDDGSLISVSLIWYGVNKENIPDSLIIQDDGKDGDIISDDGMYSIKLANDSTLIKNTLGDDSGKVYLTVLAYYDEVQISKLDSFSIGNIIPEIISITAPDTIIRPEGSTVTLHPVYAEVFDADGLETVKWVGFTSFHVDGDSLMNRGNYIYLYDDGSEDILYEPDFTSGDSIWGDGIYSFRIPVYGSGNTDPDFQTKTGLFRWEFITQDNADDYSTPILHEVIIE
ncbi:MAG: hypothetical protein VX736_00560 [Candidatus Neomarinimicrobiota bacterium]|nr:hypothetical protein [Candidatus Neomarinimicrobiota bacterium]|tara:strand:+ start:3841 stop:4698 length:858 start_codon:yes stop_codon:yes gene_type:complete